jgi:hypothetical protein
LLVGEVVVDVAVAEAEDVAAGEEAARVQEEGFLLRPEQPTRAVPARVQDRALAVAKGLPRDLPARRPAPKPRLGLLADRQGK